MMCCSSAPARRRFSGLMMPPPRKPAWYSSRYWWLLHDITANRSPRSHAELMLASRRRGAARGHRAVERRVVRPVVHAHSVGPALHGGNEQSVEDELLHGPMLLPLDRPLPGPNGLVSPLRPRRVALVSRRTASPTRRGARSPRRGRGDSAMPSASRSGSDVFARRSSAAHRAMPASTPTAVSPSKNAPATRPAGRSAGPGGSVSPVASEVVGATVVDGGMVAGASTSDAVGATAAAGSVSRSDVTTNAPPSTASTTPPAQPTVDPAVPRRRGVDRRRFPSPAGRGDRPPSPAAARPPGPTATPRRC